MQIAIYAIDETVRAHACKQFCDEGHEVSAFCNLNDFEIDTIKADPENRANIIFCEQYSFLLDFLWSFIRRQPGKRFFMIRDTRLSSATADADTCNVILPALARLGIAINPNLIEHVGLPARSYLMAV
jgi:hypothetical protein